jgi:hypothetical protein
MQKKKEKKREECTMDYCCNPQYIVFREQWFPHTI